MKKFLLLSLSIVFLAFSSGMAGEVTKEDAKKVAINSFFEKMNQYDQGISFADVVISYENTRYLDGIPAFYSFDFANGGYMIISADDAYVPIIGYSFRGEFPKGEHAYSYASFLQSYVDQVAYIRENNIQPETEILAEWKHLLTDEISTLNTSKDPKDVDPLLTNMWNQDYPYNVLCPADAGGSGGFVYVGCGATAISMIMHYYRYPLSGTGSHCYTPTSHPEYGQQCANFGSTTYQWDGMRDNIDGKNPGAIAEFSFHCAVALNMDFGPDGSSAYYSATVPGLKNYFKYDVVQGLYKTNYTQTVWINYMKADLDNAHPLFYAGQSTSGGHAFVCDGYQGNDFHFNFGWSGSGNGYYALNDVGGFWGNQFMVKNFYPTDPAYPYYASGHTVITQPSGQFTDGSGPIESYQPNTDATWLIDPQTTEDSITDITISFVEFDLGAGDYLRIYDGETAAAPMLGEYTGSTLPSQHTSTGNKLFIAFSTDGSGEGSGFKAEFRSDYPTYCSGIFEITDPVGTFDDGSGSFHYGPGATCMFNIEPPDANTITLTFNSFDTEVDKDVMKVYDGTTLLGTFSGNDIPGPFVVESGNAFITWSTNSFNSFPGWEVSYEIDNVGVEEKEAFTQLDIFPNPTTDALNVNFKLNRNQTVEMRMVNVTGEAVYSKLLSNVTGNISKSIDVSNFAKGIYILNLTSAEGSVNKKVIVK